MARTPRGVGNRRRGGIVTHTPLKLRWKMRRHAAAPQKNARHGPWLAWCTPRLLTHLSTVFVNVRVLRGMKDLRVDAATCDEDLEDYKLFVVAHRGIRVASLQQ
jgi:hypothetical protein